MEGDITLEVDNDANKTENNLAFKNNAPFINYLSKIIGAKIDNAENVDVNECKSCYSTKTFK